jgi:glycosyltransferase involved in cell wall biosynthesis
MEAFKKMNAGNIKGVVIPNGVEIKPDALQTINSSHDKSSLIIFCGSMDYLPNQEGLSWFCKKVLPLIVQDEPALKLMIVGKGQPDTNLLQVLSHENIINYGMVENVSDYYEKARVAIVPLLSGSGTRLKLLEAMGYGVPVVSTSIGAEGIEYAHEKNILIADDEVSFARSVVELIRNGVAAQNMSRQAFHFVKETYDWDIVGKKMYHYLRGERE